MPSSQRFIRSSPPFIACRKASQCRRASTRFDAVAVVRVGQRIALVQQSRQREIHAERPTAADGVERDPGKGLRGDGTTDIPPEPDAGRETLGVAALPWR
ncbi:hypothetical protein QF035_009230 [Streptomyces umbrinus]|uniref:Uncharacterized protein n=1 Tax=Streptomyces umbrinus TaxID=67370 RepID=A0ABU0T766_9ACTN|nr:hypothetical protein [Streptomyces umbrinus]MDQ1031648.1 hypothetical protein [Streptomyces umbrinus]